jgi:Na+-translocating ferredoxin:NAD+ oxidoreductase RnfC subunit
MFCSGCGLCETYSCPQGLSPRALIDEIKAQARANGIAMPRGIKAKAHTEHEEYRKVSVERLTSRLGLKKYDKSAPVTEITEPSVVKIALSQHIGVPSKAAVAVGDKVKKGDVIALADGKGLGVNIHASISGTVTDITQRYIKIEK